MKIGKNIYLVKGFQDIVGGEYVLFFSEIIRKKNEVETMINYEEKSKTTPKRERKEVVAMNYPCALVEVRESSYSQTPAGKTYECTIYKNMKEKIYIFAFIDSRIYYNLSKRDREENTTKLDFIQNLIRKEEGLALKDIEDAEVLSKLEN